MSQHNDSGGRSTTSGEQLLRELPEGCLDAPSKELLSRVAAGLMEKQAERDALHEQLLKTQQELDTAKRTIAALTKEKADLEVLRDCYAKNILALLPKEPVDPFTQEEVDYLMEHGVTFDTILEDLERIKNA